MQFISTSASRFAVEHDVTVRDEFYAYILLFLFDNHFNVAFIHLSSRIEPYSDGSSLVGSAMLGCVFTVNKHPVPTNAFQVIFGSMPPLPSV